MGNITSIQPEQNYKLQTERLKKACEEFEALFYNMIMKTGRESGFSSDLIKKSEGEKIFTEMLDYEVSKAAAKKSSGGIKDLLLKFFQENNSQVEGKKYNYSGKNNTKVAENGMKILA